MADRLVNLSAAGQGFAEVDVSFHVVGIDLQGFSVMIDGLVDLPTAFERLKATNFRYRPEILDTLLAQHGKRNT